MKTFLLSIGLLAYACSVSAQVPTAEAFAGKWMMVVHECKARGQSDHVRDLVLFEVNSAGVIAGTAHDFSGNILATVSGIVDARGVGTMQATPPTTGVLIMKFSKRGRMTGRYTSEKDFGPCRGVIQGWIQNP